MPKLPYCMDTLVGSARPSVKMPVQEVYKADLTRLTSGPQKKKNRAGLPMPRF